MKRLLSLLLLVVGTSLCLAQTNDFAKMNGLTDLRIVNGNLYDLSKAVPISGKLEHADKQGAVLVNEWVSLNRSIVQNGNPGDMLRVMACLRLGQAIPFELRHYVEYGREEIRVAGFFPKTPLKSLVAVRAVQTTKGGSDWDCGASFKGDIHEFRMCYIPTPKGKTGLIIPTREEFAEKLQADKDKLAAAKKRGEDRRKATENAEPAK